MAGQPDAVVLGCGPAGLLAAAALARCGFDVLVVDQDEPPAVAADSRAGVPQGAQLHNVLGRGQQHFDELLPGYVDALVSAGGAAADVAAQTHVYELGIRMPERPLGLQLLSAPRATIEAVARSLLPPTVKQQWATRVLGLRLSGDSVTGVETSAGTLCGALVVDALGANSPASRWSGESPVESTFSPKQWYSTLAFRRPAKQVAAPDFWLTFPSAGGTRAGLISPLGADRWSVSVSGRAGDQAPRDAQEFSEYVRSLEDDRMGRALEHAEPLGQPRTFGRPVARWRRFDQQRSHCRGLLHLGDSVAVLNPLLGQGLSVAAWQASLLGGLAARGYHALDREFAIASAGPVSDAWDLTRIFESDLTEHDWQRVALRVTCSERTHREYVRMWHLLEPPTTAAKIARAEDCT
jgi:2-polyprenyl-6-methoxyphenol hydroxylase-like FAD-dependent oxidoreductase